MITHRLPEPTDAVLPHRLGRHVAHDERSRAYALSDLGGPFTVDRSTWKDKKVRIYDPVPKPNQTVGNCTACAKAMQLNTAHNRKVGVRLDMDWAMNLYHLETTIDPFPGTYPPDDTGSNGLAAAKAAKQLGIGGTYRWIFGGADEVVQAVMAGWSVAVGTRWDHNMFTPDSSGVIHPGGGEAGGHEWIVRRYWKSRDLAGVDCWWGGWSAWIKRSDLQDLLDDQGDAHVQAHA